MSRDPHPSIRVLVPLAGLLLACGFGCTGTRTGNPAQGGPGGSPDAPTYQSSGRFSPERGGGGTDGGGWGFDPFSWAVDRPETWAWIDGGYLVVAPPGPLVAVYDLNDADAPVLAGSVSFDGHIERFAVRGSDLFLALRERTQLDSDTVPQEHLPAYQLKLVHVDLSDPTQPRRASEVVLEEGTVAQLQVAGDRVFVLLAFAEGDGELQWCGGGARDGLVAPRTASMQVESFGLDGGALTRLDSVELPAGDGATWADGDAFFASSARSGGDPTLSLVDFSDGTLVVAGPLGLDGPPAAVARQGDRLVVLVESGQGATVSVFTLDGNGGADLESRVPAPAGANGVELSSDGELALVSGDSAALLRLSDPEAAGWGESLPPDVQRLFEVPAGLLGIGFAASGQIVLSLWDGSDPAAPVQLAREETPVAPSGPLAEFGFRLVADDELLLLPLASDDGFGLGVAAIDAAGFGFQGQIPARGAVSRPPFEGQSAFRLGPAQLEVLPLSAIGASDPEGVLLDDAQLLAAEDPAAPLDTLEHAGRVLSLRERESDGRFVLEARGPDDDEPNVLVLPHRASILLPAGDQVLALGFDRFEECNLFDGSIAEVPHFESECVPERMRGLSVVSLESESRIAAMLPLETSPRADLPSNVRSEDRWLGYHRLEGGRLVLLVQRIERCNSQESCDALGVPAYEGHGSPGCNPDVQNCDELPDTITFVSGSRKALLLYLVDASSGNTPSLELQGEIPGLHRFQTEWTREVTAQLLLNDEDFAIAHEDPVYGEDGNSVRNEEGDGIVRFFLHRVQVEGDGLKVLSPVNTPGLPLGWDGDRVWSLEPGYADSGEPAVTLHRSDLRDGHAFIDESLVLGENFIDARVGGDHLWALMGSGDPCASGAESALLSVSLQGSPLEADEGLVLPSQFWVFPYDEPMLQGDELIVDGGTLPDGRLTVDVTEPDSPEVTRYSNR